MRVIFDSNVFISYLLNPKPNHTISNIFQSAVLGKFTLFLPEDLADELNTKLKNKSYLARKISRSDATEFTAILKKVTESVPKITNPIPAVTRDPKDDYLLAYALVGEADYLVTGDKDLLVLKQVAGVKILTPQQFLQVLQTNSLI